MNAAEWLISAVWAALTVYTLFSGFDFGRAFWDLQAGSASRGRERRRLIDGTAAPLREASHLWLIFAVMLCWLGFPDAFAAVTSTLYLPLSAAALGILVKGAMVTYRRASPDHGRRRGLEQAPAIVSLVTLFLLGSAAGAIASGQVPPGIGEGDPIGSWLSPTATVAGLLTVSVAVYLAAVSLCGDARQTGHDDLADEFRSKAMAAAAVTGSVAMLGLLMSRWDAPWLYHGLATDGLPYALTAVAAGTISIPMLVERRYTTAKVTACIATATLLWAFAAALHPWILPPHTTINDATANAGALREPPVVATMVILAAVCARSPLLRGPILHSLTRTH
ncbi:cytochrome d ubiquinol oxidase subunit II [Glycomyces halotolerans]